MISITSLDTYNELKFSNFIYNLLGVRPILTGSRLYETNDDSSDYDYYIPFTGNNQEVIQLLTSRNFKEISYALPKAFNQNYRIFRNGNVDLLVCLSIFSEQAKILHDQIILRLPNKQRKDRNLQTALLFSIYDISYSVVQGF